MSVAVITVVHGRHEHLRRQTTGLRSGLRRPEHHIVVAMGDSEVAGLLDGLTTLLDVPAGSELPLAEARNVGAAAALAAGADLLVFLDVDCIPGPTLVLRYAEASAEPAHSDALLCGPVAYLPPECGAGYDDADLSALAAPHPARPVPADGEVRVASDRRLFWSLSFAVRSTTWRTIGGFCPDYVGYGGEDTDFVETAHRAGVGMRWVGGATAYHQHHPVSSPPTEHLEAIVRNAQVFHKRWGWWPMSGWLEGFAADGLVRYDETEGYRLVPTGS